MRNKAKRNSSLFFPFIRFFHFFLLFRFFSHFFALNFRFASIFSLNFRLFYLCFRFRFLVFRIEVNHMKSGFFFFASKRNEIFTSISNFASEAKVRAHPNLHNLVHSPCNIYLQHKVHRVPQCLSPRRNWDPPPPLPQASVSPGNPRGEHTRLRVRGWGSPNSEDWRKSLILCLLCDLEITKPKSNI
jgi:hypothetical protein